MKIIAMVGLMGSGKDTISQRLVDHHGYTALAFADSLKDAVAIMFCWDREMLEGKTKDSRLWRESVDPWWAQKMGIPHLTPRWVLQNLGTNTIRRHFCPDLWLHNVSKRIETANWDKVIITDARFPNELGLVRQYAGKVYRIKRGEDPAWVTTALLANSGNELAKREMSLLPVHESEWAWMGLPVDGIIDNEGSLDDLMAAADRIA
jgi:hypothetical protein